MGAHAAGPSLPGFAHLIQHEAVVIVRVVRRGDLGVLVDLPNPFYGATTQLAIAAKATPAAAAHCNPLQPVATTDGSDPDHTGAPIQQSR